MNTSLWYYAVQDDWRETQTIAGTRIDNPPSFTTNSWGKRSEVNLTGGTDDNWDHFSVQWDGYIKVDQPVVIATWSDDGSRMWIDLNQDGVYDTSGNEFLNNGWGYTHEAWVGEKSTTLNTGTYKIRIQYYEWDGSNVFAIKDFPVETLGYSGVAVDSQDNVINTESIGNRVTVYDSTGQIKFYFGSPGTGNGQFNCPKDVAVDNNDNIYVVDSGNHRVQVFDSTGKFLRSFGGNGTAAGKFNNPEGITYDPKTDRIYVADTGNQRVQCFTTSGQLVAGFGNGGVIGTAGTIKRDHTGFDVPTDVAVHPITGLVYVADKINSRLEVYDATGKYVRTYLAVYQPEALCFDAQGNLYIVGDDTVHENPWDYVGEHFKGRLRVLRHGQELSGPHYTGGIDDLGDVTSGVAIFSDQSIIFSDSNNGRLVRTYAHFDHTTTISTLNSFLEPITDLDIETWGTSVTFRWKTAVPTITQVKMGTTRENMTIAGTDSRLTTDHEITITGLMPQQIRYYQVGFADSFTGQLRYTIPDRINTGVESGEKLILHLKALGVIYTDTDWGPGITRATPEEIAMMEQSYLDAATFVWQNSGFNIWIDFEFVHYDGNLLENVDDTPTESYLRSLGYGRDDDIDFIYSLFRWGGGSAWTGHVLDRTVGHGRGGCNGDFGVTIHEWNHMIDAIYWHCDLRKYDMNHAPWDIYNVEGRGYSIDGQIFGNLLTANYTATSDPFTKWVVVADTNNSGIPDDSPTNQGLNRPLPITKKTLGLAYDYVDVPGELTIFEKVTYFPWGGLDPHSNDTDRDGIPDHLDLNPAYPIGDKIVKSTPILDGVISVNSHENWTLMTEGYGYTNTYHDNNEKAQNLNTYSAWDDLYFYLAFEYIGWDWINIHFDGGCDNFLYGADAGLLQLNSWDETPQIAMIAGQHDMNIIARTHYGTMWDTDPRFTYPYNGRPFEERWEEGEGLGFPGRLVTEDDLIYRKNNYDGKTVWQVAIPWSPNVTGFIGYDGKIIGLDINFGGDVLFSTDRYAHIMLVEPDVTKLIAPMLGNVAATSSSTITVAWAAVDDASDYVVEYATADTFAEKKTVTATGTSTTLTDLTANTLYYVRVIATGTGVYRDSDYSETKFDKGSARK